MPTTSSRSTYIVHIPACPGELDEETLHSIIESQLKQSIPADSVVEQHAREYLEQYPVVYIVHAETNDIVSPTRQHLIGDAKNEIPTYALKEV